MNCLRPLAVSIAALLPFVTPLLAPSAASAQTWIARTGDWGNAGSWDTNSVPNSNTASVIFPPTEGFYGIHLEGNTYTVNQLTFQGGGVARYRIRNGTIAMAGTNAAINVGPTGSGDWLTATFVSGANLALNTAVTVNTSDPSSLLLFEPGSSITGTGSLVKTGPGVLQIESASTYTGGTTLNGGVTQISNGAALGTGSITFGAGNTALLRSVADITVSNPSITVEAEAVGTISAAAETTLTLQPTEGINLGNNATLVFGNVGGTGTVVVTGAAGDVDATSTLIVAGGTLRAGIGDASIQEITSNAGTTGLLGGTTLDFNDQGDPSNGNRITVRNLVGAGTVHIGSSAATVMELNGGNFAGAITGAGAVDIAGTVALSGASAYSGGTSLTSGHLTVGNNNALGTGTLTVQGGTTLTLTDGVSIANNVSVQGDFTFSTDGNATIAGDIDLGNATRTITLSSRQATLSGVVSGSGGLTLTGGESSSGSIIITGASGNTYTGLTTVDLVGGIVGLSKENGFALSGGVTVKSGSGVAFLNSNQQVSGTVTLEDESGALVFLSQTIDDLQGSGTIMIGAPAEGEGTPSPVLTIREGNFSGSVMQVSTPSTLVKDGPGTLTFTGTSNHTGGTIIRGGGTLAVDSDAALGAAGGEVSINNSTFQLLASFDTSRPMTITSSAGFDTNGYSGTLSGIISGSGYLVKRGDGTLRLSGTNTYTGGTYIDGGVLEISSDANLGATTGDLSIYDGTLRLLGGVTTNRSVGMNGWSAAIDTNGFNSTFHGELYGEGRMFRKIGAGTLTLTNDNYFMGDTFVEEGTLILDGSMSGNVIVGAAGPQGGQGPTGPQGPRRLQLTTIALPVFGGSGRVGGNLYNDGIVAPGNSPGTLRVDGDYFQSPTGTLQIEIAGRNPSQYDRLLIGGEANLDGAVQFIALDGFRPRGGDRFVFLQADGGLNGTTFSTVLLDAPLIAGRVDYTATTATLSFARRPIAPIFNGGDIDDEIIIVDAPRLPRLTTNQTAVAHVLDDAITDERLNRTFDELDRYSLQGIPGALDLIAPEELSAIYEIGIGSARVQAFNLDRHLSDLRLGRSGFSAERFRLPVVVESNGKTVLTPDGKTEVSGKDVFTPGPDNRWSVFLSGSGEFLDIDGDENARGYDITTSGFTLGADYRVCEGFAVGLLAGYAGTGTELTGDGHILVNSGKLGVYATAFNENWYVNALAAGGYNSYDIKRRGLGGTTRGETDGGEFTGLLAAGYDVHSGAVTWGPFAEVQYTYVGYDGFEERGSAAPLEIQSNDSESLRTRLGARFAWHHQAGRLGIRPEVRIGWQHEYLDRTRPTDSRFASGAGGVFRVEGPEIGRDSLIVNASVTFVCGERFSTYLAYDGELGRNRYESHTVSGGVGIGF